SIMSRPDCRTGGLYNQAGPDSGLAAQRPNRSRPLVQDTNRIALVDRIPEGAPRGRPYHLPASRNLSIDTGLRQLPDPTGRAEIRSYAAIRGHRSGQGGAELRRSAGHTPPTTTRSRHAHAPKMPSRLDAYGPGRAPPPRSRATRHPVPLSSVRSSRPVTPRRFR